MEKYKALRVKRETHQKIKALAALQGLSIDDYLMNVIVNHDYLEARMKALGKSKGNDKDYGGHA